MEGKNVLLIVVSLAAFCTWYLYSYNTNQRAAVEERARGRIRGRRLRDAEQINTGKGRKP